MRQILKVIRDILSAHISPVQSLDEELWKKKKVL